MIHSHIWELFNFGLQSHKFDWQAFWFICKEVKMKITIKYKTGDPVIFYSTPDGIDRLVKELRNHKDLWWYYIIETK